MGFITTKKKHHLRESFFYFVKAPKKQIQVTNLSNFLGHPAQSTTSPESYMGKSTLQVLSLGDVQGFSIFLGGISQVIMANPVLEPPIIRIL